MSHLYFRIFSYLLCFSLLIACSSSVSAQRTISGRILNINSELPVEGAAVSVFKGTGSAVTNTQGFFKLTVNAEDTLIFTHPDYKTGLIAVPKPDAFIAYMEQYHYYPEYMEGEEQLYKHLQEQIKYPRKARSRGIEGLLFVEVLIDSSGHIASCRALNALGGNIEDEIVMAFKSIPGDWTPFDIPLEKRLIFPVELRLGIAEVRPDLTGIKLPEGKLMPRIAISAISSVYFDR
jgi:hypothetical protein